MPIYEYRCTACERVSEEWVRSFDSPDEQDCPYCGKPAKRIVSNTSFQLKGGGWYVTDYGSHKNVPHESGEASKTAETSTADAVKPAETPTTPGTSTAPAASGASGTSTTPKASEASSTPATASAATPAASATSGA